MNTLIYGSTGYIGSALVAECERRGIYHIAGDRNDVAAEIGSLDDRWVVVNCAAFVPLPTVDECKNHPHETIMGNVALPSLLAQECERQNIPLVHYSTGCLYNEKKEYTEDDAPTRGFRGYCGFYVGTKIVAEEAVKRYEKHYILRIRLPFDELDKPRNYISKLASFSTVYPHTNSLSHRCDIVKATLDLCEMKAAFGTYNLVNPGYMTSAETVGRMMQAGIITKEPDFKECHGTTGCKLSTEKLLAAGIKIRDVHDALDDSIKNWKSA